MKKIFIISILFIISNSIYVNSAENIEYEAKSGKYVIYRNVTKRTLRSLPIPKTNKDYAFLQSIDKVCNIVIGNFASEERRITLIKDNNVDGTVDYVAHWYIDLKSFDVEKKPNEFCSPDKFKKLKESILQGKKTDITPNPEGIDYLYKMIKDPGSISRWSTGYKVTEYDIDKNNKIRISINVADNKIRGANIVSTVNYRYQGIVKIVPTIKHSIYCKNSKDPLIIKMTKEIVAKIRAAKK